MANHVYRYCINAAAAPAVEVEAKFGSVCDDTHMQMFYLLTIGDRYCINAAAAVEVEAKFGSVCDASFASFVSATSFNMILLLAIAMHCTQLFCIIVIASSPSPFLSLAYFGYWPNHLLGDPGSVKI